jgi:hypothetical protein
MRRTDIEVEMLALVPNSPPSYHIHLPHDTLESVLVPLNRLVLIDAVGGADPALASPPLGNALAGTGPAKFMLFIDLE